MDTFLFSLHWFKEKQLKSNAFQLYSKWSLDNAGRHNFIPFLWTEVSVGLPLIFMGKECLGEVLLLHTYN